MIGENVRTMNTFAYHLKLPALAAACCDEVRPRSRPPAVIKMTVRSDLHFASEHSSDQFGLQTHGVPPILGQRLYVGGVLSRAKPPASSISHFRE